MIALIDYGLGNISAFLNVYKRLHVPVMIASKREDIRKASKLILPGVGHFDKAMTLFNDSGMRDEVEASVVSRNVPILGVCVGMQMLAHSSDEGASSGLGWIDGRVKVFSEEQRNVTASPLPHMGWNDVAPDVTSPLFRDFDANDTRFYFLHSYFFDCFDRARSCVGSTNYRGEFCCAVNEKNVYGVQFHPEKSHGYGERLLKNFAEST
jgi:glutamine amidotransferase